MSRGFTLAEVLVVLVILGVTAAVVVPALPQLAPADPLSASVGAWTRVLGTARRHALNRAETVTLVIAPGTGRYWITSLDLRDSGEVALARSVEVLADTAPLRFTFTPSGPAHGPAVVLRDATGRREVGVDRWTGAPYALAR